MVYLYDLVIHNC